jgi:hypothetical protein
MVPAPAEEIPAQGVGAPRRGVAEEGGDGAQHIRWATEKRLEEGLKGLAIALHHHGSGQHGTLKASFEKPRPGAGA